MMKNSKELELCRKVCERCLAAKCDYSYCTLFGYHKDRGKPRFEPDKALGLFCASAVCRSACSRYCPISKLRGQKKNEAKPHNPEHFCRRCHTGLIPNKNWSASNARNNNRICTSCDRSRKQRVVREIPGKRIVAKIKSAG